MGPGSVSVIIPCRNEQRHIDQCLASTLAQEAPPQGIEVIVADGCSTDGTTEILAQRAQTDPRIRVVENSDKTTAAGLNRAIKASRGDIIVRMDAHTRYAPDYVRRCVEELEKTGADNVGGPARTETNGFLPEAIAAAYHSPFSVGGARFHDPNYEGWVDTVTYGCWRRNSFEKFGYFDEELIRNQDDEHNLRITRGGGRIWQSPRIKSWYSPRPSLKALFTQYMQYGYWKVRVIQKHKIPASWRHLVPGAFLLALLFLSVTSALLGLTSIIVRTQTWSRAAIWVFGLLVCAISLYAICILAASLLTAARSRWRLLPALPFVFPAYHFGYGYGFLRGLWDFVVRPGGSQQKFVQLTR